MKDKNPAILSQSKGLEIILYKTEGVKIPSLWTKFPHILKSSFLAFLSLVLFRNLCPINLLETIKQWFDNLVSVQLHLCLTAIVWPPTWLGLSTMTPNLVCPTEIVYFQFFGEVLTFPGFQSSALCGV